MPLYLRARADRTRAYVRYVCNTKYAPIRSKLQGGFETTAVPLGLAESPDRKCRGLETRKRSTRKAG